MKDLNKKEALFVDKMKAEGLNEVVVSFFTSLLRKVIRGERGLISDVTEIEPLTEGMVIEHQDIKTQELIGLGEQQLDKFIAIKLNGGLATSMKLDKAKSLLIVQDGKTFLEIIVQQIQSLRAKSGIKVPLLLLDSFGTSEDSLAALAKYHDIQVEGLPLDVMQNKFPKVNQDDYSPAMHPDEELNWNPPGHGDLYTVLYQTGLLKKLVDQGLKYALISNSDNLGAIFDSAIVGFMEKNNLPFLMETARRTEADKKGGHLAKVRGVKDKLRLRESANCPDNEVASFQDVSKWTDFNTNNIWLNLISLLKVMKENDGLMPLDLIVNPKQNNPQAKPETGSKKDLRKVYQLETAMGSAITYFEGARAIRIDTNQRFFPVKKTSDLFALRSDAFTIDEEGDLKLNNRDTQPIIALDEEYYISMQDLDFLTQNGMPSLKFAKDLTVKGRFVFGKDVIIKGNVSLINNNPKLDQSPYQNSVLISDGSVLENNTYVFNGDE